MKSEEAKEKIVEHIEGKRVVHYKLRDWVFSRQRYWGEPIPLIHCPTCGVVPVPEKDLPVLLPDVEKYEPTGTGESPLALIERWVNTVCPVCGGGAQRETNVMPQWAGSCWYYIRYCDPRNTTAFANTDDMRHWLPVDTYFGGAEHITLHLLYSRFWNLFLYDQGLVPVKEPYTQRAIHGIILGPDGEKMSKSRGNIVNPNDIVAIYGADTLRMYELFLGPHEATVAWNDKGIIGVRRFIERVWRIIMDTSFRAERSKAEESRDLQEKSIEKILHQTIKKVTEDIEQFRFNTAISALMICANAFASHLQNGGELSRKEKETFTLLLSPFAPHLAEELWRNSGHVQSLCSEPWPAYDESLIAEDTVTIAIQINGKTRDIIECTAGTSEGELTRIAYDRPNVKKWIAGKEIKKTIYIKERLLNIVII